MQRLVATVILLLTQNVLFGQTFDTEYYPYVEPAGYGEWVDDQIFVVPAWNAPDPFRMFSRYRLGGVRYRERGLDARNERVFLGGVDLSDNLSSYPDWTLISLVRRSGIVAEQMPAMISGTAVPAGLGRTDSYSLSATGDDLYVMLRAADRYSWAGADVRHSHRWKKGWSHSLVVTGQLGADGHIKGVGSNEAGGVASVAKTWQSGASLTLFAAGGYSVRGARTAATREAFELTGDNLYNPTWGLQNGRVRNSRENRTQHVFAAVRFEAPLGSSDGSREKSERGDEKRTLSVTLAFRHNRQGRTRLAWYDAPSPMPDYYLDMPSAMPDGETKKDVAGAWRAGDPSLTQIDWQELYFNNTLDPDGRATYIVEEQVERAGDMHFDANITRRLNRETELVYGVNFRRDRSRFFKTADDMLGAEWVSNVDQYITDDDGEYRLGPPNENDLRNPGRQIRQGDRFGYDYAVTRTRPSARAVVRWNRRNFGLTASASLTHTSLRRHGFYEKELFPGEESFGRSEAMNFTTYTINAAAYWNISVKHSISLSAIAGSEPPFADDVFVSPRQNNHAAASAVTAGIYGAEISWAFAGRSVDVRVSGFVSAATNETMIRPYYDDLSGVFSNMIVRGIDRLNYGLEVGMEARITSWLTLTAGGSIGEFRYNSEPTAIVLSDATGETVSEGIICYMSGLHTGSPQVVAAAELAYSDRRHWRAAISCEYWGFRYVEINPLYHSSRIAGISAAPEIMREFTSQERLPDAVTLGLSLSKGFVLKRGYLRVAAGVRNLLSSTIIHSGYEQMRIARRGAGLERVLVPFPSKYLYAYPLTWSLNISYRL